MKSFLAFTKKELLEQVRTFKLLIIVSVFFLFGMLSPLTAKLLPELLSGMTIEGMVITIPEPTAMDAYTQFFKNMTQVGVLILLLVFGGTLSGEITKGTLINILAKGLHRNTVILSKYTAAVLLWTLGYVISALTSYGYTVYLFKHAMEPNLIFSFFCLWLFGCFIIALIFLSSTLTGGNFGGLVLSAAALIILLTINVIPKVEKYNPITLASKNVALLTGAIEAEKLLVTVVLTCIFTIGGIILSLAIFKRKRL
jgi:ABC-2 type transport system permease protein